MLDVFIFFVSLLALIAVARRSGPAKNKQGTQFNHRGLNQDCKQEATFAVGTFNIQGGKDVSRNPNIMDSAQAIKDADLVGIQEVFAPDYLNKLGLGKSQTQILAESGNFDWLFCATCTRWFREFRGNAVVSKLPVKNWRIEMLCNESGISCRNMVIVELTWQGVPFHFINTHLHTRDSKQTQLDKVLEEFDKYPRVILLGDFNSRPHETHIKKMLQKTQLCNAINVIRLDADEKNRVDWVLTKGFNVHHGKMVERGISDHPYYQVSLSIK